ncbi:uncharacterized protein EKO05_0006263 [Ascochyta rabiei]|nr:uncharacterized protein EKO05_0006263 [Ascochyta rabiei]UPX15826.1 hypothetical protein EKO05_0006263 [Ascochyta rabiei]
MKAGSESRTLGEQPDRASIESLGKRSDCVAATASRHQSKTARTRSRSTQSGYESTRTYDTGRPARRAAYQQQSAALKFLYKKPTARPVSAKPDGSEEDDDDIIKWSMYPQVIGKRRSELVRARAQYMKSSRASTTPKGQIVTDRPTNHATRHEYRSHCCSVGSGLSYDSGYDTESIMDDRPVRACIYPQLKYCKVPGKMPAEPQQRDPVLLPDNTLSRHPSSHSLSSRIPWNNTYRPGGLPHDEYRILVRRQKMQRVREMLEAFFAHHGNRQGPRIWHGLKQAHRIRQTERRRVSKVNLAVRKAMKANLDLRSNGYELARYRHAGKIPYCELSDVDGVPLPPAMIDEFTRAFRDAQDDAYMLKLTPLPYGQPIQHTWVDERVRQAAACHRMDSGIVMEEPVERPQLVSRFSWDSDSDQEVRKRKRLTKVKR